MQDVQRWQLPAVTDPVKRSHAMAAAPAISVTLDPSAVEAAYQKGHAEGFASGQVDVQALQQRLTELLQMLDKPIDEFEQVLSQDILSLIQIMTEKLLATELQQAPEKITALIEKALKTLPSTQQKRTLFLHPDDLILVEKAMADNQVNLQHCELNADEKLARHTCHIHTEQADVEVSISQCVEELVCQLDSKTD